MQFKGPATYGVLISNYTVRWFVPEWLPASTNRVRVLFLLNVTVTANISSCAMSSSAPNNKNSSRCFSSFAWQYTKRLLGYSQPFHAMGSGLPVLGLPEYFNTTTLGPMGEASFRSRCLWY